MYKVEYKRDYDQNYLIFSDLEIISEENYQIRMITTNILEGVLKCKIRKMDGKQYFYYEITSKQPISRIYDKKKLSGKELIKIICGILDVMEKIKEYLLDINQLLIEPEYFYMDISSGHIFLCYLPGHNSNVYDDFHRFTEYILQKLDHEDKLAVMLGYDIFRHTTEENYSFEKIKELLFWQNKLKEENKNQKKEISENPDIWNQSEDIQEKPVTDIQKEDAENKNLKTTCIPLILFSILLLLFGCGVSAFLWLRKYSNYLMTALSVMVITIAVISYLWIRKYKSSIRMKSEEEQTETYQVHLEENTEEWMYRKEETGEEEQYDDEDKATLVEDYGATMVLSYEPQSVTAHLCGTGAYSQYSFSLDKSPFLIGKLSELADGVVPHQLISRVHAQVNKEQAEYFLTDLNSTNGTFLNDRRIEANETVRIKDGDAIQLACVTFLFEEESFGL